jgi:hypothetical protein
MAAAPPLYVRCPRCGEIVELQQPGELSWLNTCWTDGHNFDWSLRGFTDNLFRGYSCGKLFWQTSAEIVWNPLRDIYGGDESKYVQPPFCEYIDSEPYHLNVAIEQGMCRDSGQELYVRVRLWWYFNAPFRPLLDPGQDEDRGRLISATVECSEDFETNARRLLEILLPSDARERILSAELHRELGEFDAAIALLSNTANLLFAVQELEREQSRLFQAEVRARVGNDPIWNCSARSEVLVTIARRILGLTLEEDTLVRPVEQEFAEFSEVKPEGT